MNFFKNFFDNICGICHEFSVSKAPQQNVIFERKIRTLQEMAILLIEDMP